MTERSLMSFILLVWLGGSVGCSSPPATSQASTQPAASASASPSAPASPVAAATAPSREKLVLTLPHVGLSASQKVQVARILAMGKATNEPVAQTIEKLKSVLTPEQQQKLHVLLNR